MLQNLGNFVGASTGFVNLDNFVSIETDISTELAKNNGIADLSIICITGDGDETKEFSGDDASIILNRARRSGFYDVSGYLLNPKFILEVKPATVEIEENQRENGAIITFTNGITEEFGQDDADLLFTQLEQVSNVTDLVLDRVIESLAQIQQ